jgi:hypothetical protein
MGFKEGVYKMTIKKDCFAYNATKNECNACKDLKCQECAFYKERKRFIYEKAKVDYRLRNDRQRLSQTQSQGN